MSTYILVHGSFHGGWCWNKVVPQLVKAGHKVVALDLPAHGEDTTPIPQATMQAYVDTVLQVVDTRKEPVILVGHSFAGMIISQVAEQRPDAVQSLIYLAALLPVNGEFAMQYFSAAPDSPVVGNVIINEAEGWISVNEDAIPGLYYNDCSAEDIAYAKANFVKEPLQPYTAPVTLTAENFGRVRKYYVKCLQDNAVVPAMADMFLARTAVNQVFTLDASHSPFFSAPEELADILKSVAVPVIR